MSEFNEELEMLLVDDQPKVEETQPKETETEAPKEKAETPEAEKEDAPAKDTPEKEEDDTIKLDFETEPAEEEKKPDTANYGEIATLLGLEKDAAQSDILDHIAETKTQLEITKAQLEQKGSAFFNEDIQKINEIAKSGQDYKSYFNQTKEVEKIDGIIEQLKSANPKDVVTSYFATNGKDKDWIDTYLDAKEDFEIEAKASDISEDYIGKLNKQKEGIQSDIKASEQKAEDFKKNYLKGISGAANGLEQIEKVQIRPSQREQIKQELLADGINKIFPKNENGEPDYKVWVENAAKIKMFPHLVNEIKKRTKSIAKKENFDKLHNIEGGKDNAKEVLEDKGKEFDPMEEFSKL